MRVLIAAYTCTPGSSSEPGVGWSFVRAAAMDYEVVLLTLPRNTEALESALTKERVRGVRIIPVPSPRWLLHYQGRVGLGTLDYLIWQWRVWAAARTLREHVDVAHHVTYGNDWLPSGLHFLRGVPVVWGPVGGAAPLPRRLLRYLSPRGIAEELLRELATRPIRVLTVALVRWSGCCVVAANSHTAGWFRWLGVPVFIEPTAAMPADLAAASVPRINSGSRRAVFIGRLSSWKGPYLALHTMAELGAEWRLDVYGTGSEQPRMRRVAKRLGIADRVHFLGWRPREEIWQALQEADVLVFPAMHDPQPYTVAEAVRSGCPVVCLDVGGAPLLIEGTPGAAVKPDAQTPRRLAEAMRSVRRYPPSDRWNADRLPGRLAEWYATAIAVKRGASPNATVR
jgi:glycosyltransferase involved in cell wall biosynthesis